MDELKALVIKAQAGDSSVYEEIYNATKSKAYYLALQLLKNPHDAEDTLQDSFINAFTKLNTLDNPEKFQGFLDTIVINRAKDVLKKKKPMAFSELQSDDGKEFVPEDEEERTEFLPAENMDYQETKRLIQEIISELPEEQRMAVMLYYYNEMPVGQIAEYFECSTGTIKSRLNYARKTIKAKVEELEKKGTKLYCIPVLPFLYWMFRSEAEEAVYTSSNVVKNILDVITFSQTKGEMLYSIPDSVAKEIAGNGTKKLITGKAASMGVGVKASIAAIIAAVSITSGILIYQMHTHPKESETSNFTQELDVSVEKPDEEDVIATEIPATTIMPTVAPTEAVVKEEAFTVEGTWNRTNVNSGEGGVMEITNLDDEGFDFMINVSRGGNVGEESGHAVMDNNIEASAKIDLYDGTFATFHFKIVDEQVEVTTENADFLGGMETSFDGTYIKGEPSYINKNIVEETLGNYQEDVKNLLGESYVDLTCIMEEGTSYETDLTYSGFISGVGVGADLWIKDDGKIYCLINDTFAGYRFYTNDADYQNKVPKEFSVDKDKKIEFIYVEPSK